MATETKGQIFLPFILGIEQEDKKNPNYRPQICNQEFPHLSSSLPNLIKPRKSIPFISFADFTLDSGPIAMDEEPRRVARSVAAACLLQHFAATEPVFIPTVSVIMVQHMNHYGLISPTEKDSLMKAGGDSEDSVENMVLAIEEAVLSIEKDTGGVSCFPALNLYGKGKDRVYVKTIQVDKLVKELLPISLRFQDLSVSATDVPFDNEEYQRKEGENISVLDPRQNLTWFKCPTEPATTSTPAPTRTPRIPTRTPRIRRFRYKGQRHQ